MLLLLQWDLKCAIVYTREVICCKHVKWDISTIYDKLLLHAGLFLTYLALFLMDGHGQPALLYLVPCTLGKYGHCSLDFVIIMVSFTLRTGVIVIDALSFHSCTRAYCYPWLGKRWPTRLVELRKRSNWKRGRWTLRSEILTNDTGVLVTSILFNRRSIRDV